MRQVMLRGAIAGAVLAGVTGFSPAQFDSLNVTLRTHIPLSGFDSGPASGNDCWGYVSSSGREYALMCISNALAVVEVTDPDAANIIAEIPHSDSLWGDVKVYQDYAYVVNESGGGIDVIDLSDADNGNVTLVQRETESGMSSSHNVAINTDSGYLYTCGSNLNGGRLVAWNLADPADPQIAGQMSSIQGEYVHDAHIITYTSGPYAGREIAFCCNGGVGVDIYDVTNKSSMFRLSRSTYPGLSYCHQGWVSEDRQYFYLNDEADSVNQTLIFDVSDLENPFVAGDYTSGLPATDHNLFIRDGIVYEADYRSGLRVFDANDDPLNPTQIAWFDTYPGSDGGGFDGAWSNYPFLPSGNVIISDIDRGMFFVTVGEPLLDFEYPEGLPDLIDPAGDTITVQIIELEPDALEDAVLQFDAGGGFQEVPLSSLGGELYEAQLPAIACGAEVRFYIDATTTGGDSMTDPVGAPTSSYITTAALDIIVAFEDDMETDPGYTVENIDLEDGAWERGVPIGEGLRGDPPTDFDGSGAAWLTANAEPGDDGDVDGGPTRLISPSLDLSAVEEPYISYARWFTNDDQDADRLDVHISGDGGGSWTLVESVSNQFGWQVHTFRVADFVTPTDDIKLRFSATDNPNDSVTEAAIDALRVISYVCESAVPGDVDGDGDVDFTDLLALLSAWGECPAPPAECPADFDGSGTVDFTDLLTLLSNWS